MWSLEPRGCIPTENTSFGGFITGPHCQDRILESSRLAATFPELKPVGLLYLEQLANLDALRLFVTAEWDRLAAGYT
jgi:hypothetical protein